MRTQNKKMYTESITYLICRGCLSNSDKAQIKLVFCKSFFVKFSEEIVN